MNGQLDITAKVKTK